MVKGCAPIRADEAGKLTGAGWTGAFANAPANSASVAKPTALKSAQYVRGIEFRLSHDLTVGSGRSCPREANARRTAGTPPAAEMISL